MWTSNMQIIILAGGRGSRMTELIGNTIPKCLIPISGNPLIFYPMKSLAENGFAGKEVLVITQDRDDVRKSIEAIGERVGLIVDTFVIQEDSEDFGTAESLRLALLAKKITKDVLIISCDLIGEIPLKKLLKLHGLKNSSCTALFMKNIPPSVTNLPGPKNKAKHIKERDIVGIKLETSEMVLLSSEADLDEDLSIPVATLKHYPHFKIITNLTDAHVYILKKKLLDKLLDPELDEDLKPFSLKGEFIPSLIQNQFENEGNPDKEIPSFYCLIESDKKCIRVNSIYNYALVNQSIDWLKNTFKDSISRSKETKIGKGCKLITAALGDHCSVGEKSKLTNVIGMDHVTIEQGCEIQNTIISSNALIGANCFIKDCLVGPKFQAVPGARHVNEYLTVVEETFFEA